MQRVSIEEDVCAHKRGAIYLSYVTLYFTEVLDYVFYNETLIFNGSYSVGDSECMTVRVFAPDDNLVESTEVFKAIVSPGASSLTSVSIFIIDNDCEWALFLMCIVQQ